jgi:hypothetical protein
MASIGDTERRHFVLVTIQCDYILLCSRIETRLEAQLETTSGLVDLGYRMFSSLLLLWLEPLDLFVKCI